MHKMDKMELLAAVQACMIYLIMCIVDYSVENEGEGLELLLTLHVSSIRDQTSNTHRKKDIADDAGRIFLHCSKKYSEGRAARAR